MFQGPPRAGKELLPGRSSVGTHLGSVLRGQSPGADPCLAAASPGAVFGKGVSCCFAFPSQRFWAVGEQPRSPEVSRAGSHALALWGCGLNEGREEWHCPASSQLPGLPSWALHPKYHTWHRGSNTLIWEIRKDGQELHQS